MATIRGNMPFVFQKGLHLLGSGADSGPRGVQAEAIVTASDPAVMASRHLKEVMAGALIALWDLLLAPRG